MRRPATRHLRQTGLNRSAGRFPQLLSRFERREIHFRRGDGKSFAGFSRSCRFDGGIQREQVRLVRDGLDASYNLADAGGRISKLATSVDFATCEAISPIDAASSSTELAATFTFSDAAVTRLWAISACSETVSAALLRPVVLSSIPPAYTKALDF